jgi:RimJ/RimL family protein N-acetyltransferase
MPRTPAKHTQADFARAIRAMQKAGFEPELVFEQGGNVILRPCQHGEQPANGVTVDKGGGCRL